MGNSKKIAKVVLFFILGVFLFVGLQTLLAPKWNSPNVLENTAYVMDSFYAIEKNEFDVVFLGTSQVEYAVSPMEIYKDTGITSFNLGGPGQPIELTYYMLKECLKTQTPQLVIMDASAVVSERTVRDENWHVGLDGMKFSLNKIDAAVEYAKVASGWKEQQKRFNSVIFPVLQYHTRYKEIGEIDFRDYFPVDNYYSMGYLLHPVVEKGVTTVEEMNVIAEQLNIPNTTERTEYWIKRIRELCEENNIKFQMIKVPSIYDPGKYVGAWPESKYRRMKEFCDDNNISYLDLLYDVDLGIDIETDYKDGGCHLNYKGALKVTRYISSILLQEYEIESKSSKSMDSNMQTYDMISEVALLQLETDVAEYLKKVFDKEGYIVFEQQESGIYAVCINGKCVEDESQLNKYGQYKEVLSNLEADIVIVDRETGCILDSIIFKEDTCVHNNTWTYLNDYWQKKVNNQ